jgi:hypothetical protein
LAILENLLYFISVTELGNSSTGKEEPTFPIEAAGEELLCFEDEKDWTGI